MLLVNMLKKQTLNIFKRYFYELFAKDADSERNNILHCMSK